MYGQPRDPWPKNLSRSELRNAYRMGYKLAKEKYPELISSESLLVPSAYDSEVETEEEEDLSRASPYPIGIKWARDSNGVWRVTNVSTSKSRMKRKSVQEAVACANLTQDIPEGSASADVITIADDDDGAAAEPRPSTSKAANANYPLRVRAPDPRREQDEQEKLFSAARETEGKHRDPLRVFFAKTGNLWSVPGTLRPSSPHNFCPETEAENYQMPNQADQATRYSHGYQDPPRPANMYPKRWRQVNRSRKKKAE